MSFTLNDTGRLALLNVATQVTMETDATAVVWQRWVVSPGDVG